MSVPAMSNRERWILYPLLFFSLMLGLRATYLDPLEFRCREIECQSLTVQSINGAPFATPGAASSTNGSER